MNELTLNLCLQFTTRTQNQTLGNPENFRPGTAGWPVCYTRGCIESGIASWPKRSKALEAHTTALQLLANALLCSPNK